MKALILAGGKGEELFPIAVGKPKGLVKIVGKPVLQRIIEALSSNGVNDVTIVVDKDDTQIQDFFGNGNNFGIRIKYVKQVEYGIEKAILSAEKEMSNENNFLLLHSDIIFEDTFITKVLNTFENTSSEIVLGLALQGEVQEFGVAKINSQGFVDKIITGEKGLGNYVIAGISLMTSEIFDYLKKTSSFIDALNKTISDGKKIAAAVWPYTWIDIGRPWDIINANKFILSKLDKQIISSKAEISNSKIIGPVIIEEDVTIKEGAVIRGPAYIGKNAYIGNNTLIREFSTLENNSVVGMGVELKNSVIMPHGTIHRLSYVGDSVIDEYAVLSSGTITVNYIPGQQEIIVKVKDKQVNTGLMKLGAFIGHHARIGVHSTIYPGIKISPNKTIPHGSVVKKDI